MYALTNKFIHTNTIKKKTFYQFIKHMWWN